MLFATNSSTNKTLLKRVIPFSLLGKKVLYNAVIRVSKVLSLVFLLLRHFNF